MSAERMLGTVSPGTGMGPAGAPWTEPRIPSDGPQNNRQFAVGSLQRQAQEIIDEVLESSDPGEDLSRARLRRFVANNPGRPELALLAQLMATRDVPGFSGTS